MGSRRRRMKQCAGRQRGALDQRGERGRAAKTRARGGVASSLLLLRRRSDRPGFDALPTKCPTWRGGPRPSAGCRGPTRWPRSECRSAWLSARGDEEGGGVWSGLFLSSSFFVSRCVLLCYSEKKGVWVSVSSSSQGCVCVRVCARWTETPRASSLAPPPPPPPPVAFAGRRTRRAPPCSARAATAEDASLKNFCSRNQHDNDTGHGVVRRRSSGVPIARQWRE